VTVVTYLDKLKDKEEKEEAFEQASWATGSSSERTYFVANYLHVDSEQSFEVDRAALDILDSALLSAESFIRIRKQREKNQMEREVAAGGNIFSELDGEFKETETKTAAETKTSLKKNSLMSRTICIFTSALYLGLPCKTIGDTRQKVWIKCLKETNLSGVQALFNP